MYEINCRVDALYGLGGATEPGIGGAVWQVEATLDKFARMACSQGVANQQSFAAAVFCNLAFLPYDHEITRQ
jgi:hypothetical protein